MTTISGLSNAQVGDCLNCANSHVVIITKIYTSNGVTRYEICEQTPPKAKKSEYTAAEVQEKYLNKGYIIRRYNGRDNVAAPDVVGLYGFIDVNGRLDGVDKGSLEGFGTFDIAAGTETGSALTHDDRARSYEFAAVSFDTQHLRLTVTTVSAARLSFFMCHDMTP